MLNVMWLALVWTALWGSVEPGTVVAGLLIGTAVMLLVARGEPSSWGSFRPLAALRYLGVFSLMLAQATFEVVAAVITPSTRVAPAVVEVDLPDSTPGVVTMVANSITLTPGTLTLDATVAEGSGARLRVHALNASDPVAVRDDVLRLHRLAAAVFSGPAERSR
ncbi:MAG TPA: Na+/H+ antiporter subunit E [Egibacteraceae bacterium]|nr:Na+/H+ antiporter subunit E [Egibacteraceae bacterium]